MRAQRGQLVGVQAAGKEGAHDAGLDGLPIRFGGFREDAALVIVQLENAGILEEMAVEVANLVLAEQAALGHRAEKRFKGLGELPRGVEGDLGEFGKEVLRQQTRVLGEEAEDQPVEEPGDAEVFPLGNGDFGAGVGVRQFDAFALLQRTGDLGKLLREGLGDLGGGALGFEEIGILEQEAENAQVFRAVNLVVGELVGFLDGAVEVGADNVAVEIADDEQGRIEEGLAVAEELLVGFVQVLFLALVFPAEAALLPYVGKAAFGGVAGVGVFEVEKLGVFDDTLLVAEEIAAGGVGLGWRLLAEQPAQVVEMPLVR